MKRAKLDEERLEKELPDVYKKYVVEKFDTTTFGKKEKKLKAEYTLPAEPNPEKTPEYVLSKRDVPKAV